MAEKSNPYEKKQGNVLNVSDPKVYEAIRKRAYELYCKRGYAQGNDMRDWLEAEKQVKRELGSTR
ncbi:MAG: DUF2934 domain-containing protein [bacterium]